MISTDFYNNGFQIFDLSDAIIDINLENRHWEYEGRVNGDYHLSKLDSFYPLQESWLLGLHYEISKRFVEPSFKTFTIEKRRLWKGVNKDATVWHNDGREGPNCFFLLYFSDMESLKEGAVHFKNKTKEWKVYPNRGKLAAVNCLPEFLHKADQTKHERIIASFYFNLDHGTYYQADRKM